MSEGTSETNRLVAAILAHAVIGDAPPDAPAAEAVRIERTLEVYHALLVKLGRM